MSASIGERPLEVSYSCTDLLFMYASYIGLLQDGMEWIVSMINEKSKANEEAKTA